MTTKRITFKSSKLSSAADQLWLASKNGFKADEKSIKLDLGKTLTKDTPEVRIADFEETCATGSFIFGSKMSEKVIINNEDKETKKSTTVSCAGDGFTQLDTKDATPKSVMQVFEEIKQKGAASSFIISDKGSSISTDSFPASSTSLTKLNKPIEAHEKNAVVSSKSNVFTGEEGEVNIYRAMCKLHSFDSRTKSWKECGLSCLHINQYGLEFPPTYRIVGRGMGNQRVILNSQIFSDMIVEKVSMKRLKFSATAPDSEVPVLFLASASEFVTTQLHEILFRIVEEKKRVSRKRRVGNSSLDPVPSESSKEIRKN
ncbi:unnamed protein product [Thelazia callipaeda]|uniref:RanBD1 domain-containing protein n=1 Tax=Thelazia callipaeda TaxID=103827 RepID=A0A0N5D203_THECL|nr:unnamed protein product [Thelazia callipaeda]